MKTISINTLSKQYDVLLGSGLLSSAADHICRALGISSGKGLKLCLVTDRTVDGLYAGEDQALMTSLREGGFELYKYVYPGGEDNKKLSTVEGILDFLVARHFNRGDLLLAFGGGITGDITGFAAAIYMRGIKYIQIPTTLLSSVDSSVGGKTGVNLAAGKNLTGAFWQPELVIFDPDVLRTLEYTQLLDGMGEIIKAGMIADRTLVGHVVTGGTLSKGELEALDFGSYIDHAVSEDGGQARPAIFSRQEALLEAIARSVNIKRAIVEEDEREQGRRRLLNFGHTIAHAIEKCSDYAISHGNAVGIGMCIASRAAESMGWVLEPSAGALTEITAFFGYPQSVSYTPAQLAQAAMNDKKAGSDSISIIYAEVPGSCVSRKIPLAQLEDFIRSGL